MRKRSRFIVAIAAFAVVLGVLILILSRDPEKSAVSQTLPDGSTIALTGWAVGNKAEFVHGTLWQKILYRILPDRGLTLSTRSFQRPVIGFNAPADERRLFLEFKLDNLNGSAPASTASNSLANVYAGSPASFVSGPLGYAVNLNTTYARLVISGNDGFDFINPFAAHLVNGYYYLQPVFYPRQSKTLTIRIEQRDSQPQRHSDTEVPLFAVRTGQPDSRPVWRTAARFTIDAKPEPEQSWTAEPFPIKRKLGYIEFVLLEASVLPSSADNQNISKYEGRFRYQVLENGRLSSPWLISMLEIRDAGGNQFKPNDTAIVDEVNSSWAVARIFQTPDPRKVWRMRFKLRHPGGRDPTNTFEFFVGPVQKN